MGRLAVLLAMLAVSRAVAAAASLEAPGPAAPALRPRLQLSGAGAAALAAGAGAAWSLAAAAEGAGRLGACRWCETNALDRGARAALRWGDAAAAGEASDVLRLAVPLGSAAAVAWLAARDGGGLVEALEDVLAVGAALAISAPLATAVKHGTARVRPSAARGACGENDLHSFYSGHASQVFAAAVAATQIARMRGRRGWRWLGALAVGTAATTAWLRIAADQHWATDALAGAGAGALVGLAVPALVLRRPKGALGAPAASLAPAPGGVAILF